MCIRSEWRIVDEDVCTMGATDVIQCSEDMVSTFDRYITWRQKCRRMDVLMAVTTSVLPELAYPQAVQLLEEGDDHTGV